MESYFDTSHISRFIHLNFNKSDSTGEIKKAYCNRSFGKKCVDFVYGDIKDFDIVPVKSGKMPYVIFINGFLTADEKDNRHWKEQLQNIYPDNAWYHLRWNSKKLLELGGYFTALAGKAAIGLFERQAIKTILKEVSVPILAPAWISYDIATNPWYQAMYRAEQTGELLAEYLHRNDFRSYILWGHSLGARVIFYTLKKLALKRDKPVVREARLMGGAVGKKPVEQWRMCGEATERGVFNYYSKNDQISSILYRYANLNLSEPVGISPISCRGVRDRDATAFVSGHSGYVCNMRHLYEINPFKI